MSGLVSGSGLVPVRVRVWFVSGFVFGEVSEFATFGFVSGFVPGFVSGSCLVSVWVRVGFVSGSCLVFYLIRVLIVFVSRSCRVRVWFVFGSYLGSVWFDLVRVCFASG